MTSLLPDRPGPLVDETSGELVWTLDREGRFTFVNDEQFSDCPRPGYGPPDRWLGPTKQHRKYTQIKLDPWPLATFGLDYDSNWLPRRFYVSDSGGEWNKAWDEVEREAWGDEGQLHMLIHPDWWGQAFV